MLGRFFWKIKKWRAVFLAVALLFGMGSFSVLAEEMTEGAQGTTGDTAGNRADEKH